MPEQSEGNLTPVARHAIIKASGIRSIRHRGLRRPYERPDSRDLPAALSEKISDILLAIDEAAAPAQGRTEGFWSVTVSGNWRVIFRFEKGDAFDLDFVDYH